ncbi:DUF3592 domain-containing protein [Nonlabens sp. Asnod2-A12]|uniref:DUF3592 domain-containing protein n=1 Tax=Nonlabens sp. Asnod2-A12 TaxID=3160578 RepID=UPI00386FC01D
MRLAIYITLLLVACYIAYRIAQRMASDKDPDEKPGCIMVGYVTLVYLCMCALSFTFLSLTLSGLYGNVVHHRYEATVIDVRTYESEDSDGNTTTMYAPTVQFTTDQGDVITRELNISSGEPYQNGEIHPVSYNQETNDLDSRSIASVVLMLAGLLMSLFLLGYVIIGIAYAFYIPIGINGMEYTAFIFVYILMPLGMIGMNAGLIYYVVQRLTTGYKSDQPIWVLIVVIFFIIVLTLSKISIIKIMLSKNKK